MILLKSEMENEHFYIFEHRACVWFWAMYCHCFVYFFLIDTYYLNSASQ